MRTSEPTNGREPTAVPDGPDTYDVVGIGFGPANLALAVCLEEAAEEPGGRDFSRLFLEAKPKAVWHPGLLLEDSLIQISVLKDLATVRNPRSYFTFLNYLKAKGRLFEFLNLRDLFPTRIEFNDYLSWVAGELRERVRYGREVVALEPVTGAGNGNGNGTVERLRVVTRNIATGKTEALLTRSVVLATGGVPCMPQGIQLTPGGRAFHASEFLHRMRQDFPDKQGEYRFVVVGSGQSGAELFCYLLNHYPRADVTAAIRRFSYKPVDGSDFTNEIFFPQMVDYLYELPDEKRQLVLDQCKDVNYAVVDMALIRRIYRCLYQEKVEGKNRARIRPFLQLTGLEERPGSIVARFEHLVAEQPLQIEADAVVVATGYSWKREHPLLASLSPYIVRTAKGAYRMERDYRLATAPGFLPRLYLQGFAEDTHGASEPVLSLLPIRAGDIVKSMSAAAVPAVLPEAAGQSEPAAVPTF
ncbi:MAG TPA: SidA/IucD/PvdA family monooxygenase [Thermoanaerobaculia bacterium]|nr:SidA/IucD/PvdA family monooxygenase [Thermoanaerobaculia bacterium]